MAEGSVKGLSQLRQKLLLLPKVAKVEIAKAMELGADDIVSMAKQLASRFTDSGDLQMSIGWTWGEAPRGALTLASVKGKGTAGDLKITVYAGNDKAFYARWVEFGTAPHSVAKGGGTVGGKKDASRGKGTPHPGAKAQPFFFVSYRANRKRVRSRITRAINKSARQVANGGK